MAQVFESRIFSSVSADAYDAIYLPGGEWFLHLLRENQELLDNGFDALGVQAGLTALNNGAVVMKPCKGLTTSFLQPQFNSMYHNWAATVIPETHVYRLQTWEIPAHRVVMLCMSGPENQPWPEMNA